MKNADINIDLVSDPRLLGSVRGLVRTYLLNEGFDSDRASEIVLAVDEACTNAMRHSYGGSTDNRLRLTVRKYARGIEFVLRDRGVPVPVEKCERKEIAVPDAAHLTPGGLGVQLIHRVFDEVKFQPGKTAGNRVVMRLISPEKSS
ncbi:MAG TPA: ATP-binding protein [Candidatus Hydrogenedentes bacterium]|nr:ATP-binding protein [Candidatus Hydrogenedentota bacterium]